MFKMSYKFTKDKTYTTYSGVAISYEKTPRPYAMPHPHIHDDYELFILIEGGRKFFLSNTIFSLESQSALLINPNDPHRTTINLNSELERYVIYISPKLMDTILKENHDLKSFLKIQRFKLSNSSFEMLMNLVLKIKDQLDLQDIYSKYQLKNLIIDIIILLLRESSYNEDKVTTFEKNDLRIQTAINYIIEHCHEPITLESCANIAYMSPAHFSRQFHLITGVNFKEFLNKVRIDKACELLKSKENYRITELTFRSGFTNSSYFTSVFHQMTGLTPTQYKKSYHKK